MTQYSVPSTQPRPLARTPLHHWHVAHGARFVERDGWHIPAEYTSVDEELAAAWNGVGLTDLSGSAKLSLHGAGVAVVARELVGNESASRPGAVAHFAVDHSVLVCRLAEDQLLLLATNTGVDTLERQLANIQSVVRHDVTTAYAGFSLLGPATEVVLRRLAAFDVSPAGMPPATCSQTALAGVAALLVRPPGEPTVRVYVTCDQAQYVLAKLLKAGQSCGLKPLGLDAFLASRAN